MENLRVLVTGGSGFLGKAIVRELTEKDSPLKTSLVRVFDIVDYKGARDSRIQYVKGDIRNFGEVNGAVAGVDVVIHSAAIVDWGTRSEVEVLDVNYEGTRNIIRACREQRVGSLVYTSSLDAVYGGKPLVGIDESVPYPPEHETVYCRSKYLSEKEVMAANDGHLQTVTIRPSDIYGEGDPYHMGSLINMARGGFYVRLGNGKARCQHTYVGNVARAHLLAAHALLNGNEKVAGNAYFITDGPGTNFFKFFDQIVLAAGYRIWPKNLWIPRGLAYAMGTASELVAWLSRPFKKYHPKFSRFAVTYTCTDFTFSSEKAIKDFGFDLKYPEEEALRRTAEYFRKDGNRRFPVAGQ